MEIIQKIVLPQFGICQEESLFFRNNEKAAYLQGDLAFERNGISIFDTYFNAFSATKWKKYTGIKTLQFKIVYKGAFQIEFYQRFINNGVCFDRALETYCLKFASDKTNKTVTLPFDEMASFTYFKIVALENDSHFFGGAFVTDDAVIVKNDVKISLIICTYKREKYVLNNLEILKRNFIENSESDLYGNLYLKIIDNGNTLESISEKYIQVYHNKNLGGSSGFTRGIIESLNEDRYSHVLLMDDDVVIEVEAIYRLYKFLLFMKPQYQKYLVGGSMLKLDFPFIQQEAGVCWNNGLASFPYKYNLDLRDRNNVFRNEIEEHAEINGWWFSCIPTVNISLQKLPLPIFIRYDDMEYSLRIKQPHIFLNGICVWHESFENKYASNLEYYTMRNHLITYILHSPSYSSKELIKFLRIQLINKLYRYRYKDLELNFRAVYDFLKGIDFFHVQNAELLHQKVLETGYTFKPLEELNVSFNYFGYERNLFYGEGRKKKIIRKFTLNGYLLPARGQIVAPAYSNECGHYFRVGQVINYDEKSGKAFITNRDRKQAFKLLVEYFRLCFLINKNFKQIKSEYNDRINEISNINFWKPYLEIDKMNLEDNHSHE